jgi:hypothetical protein
VNRLRQRLDRLQHALETEGGCAVVDYGSEDIEARIALCRAEAGLSARDLIVIVKGFCDGAPGEAQEPLERCGR